MKNNSKKFLDISGRTLKNGDVVFLKEKKINGNIYRVKKSKKSKKISFYFLRSPTYGCCVNYEIALRMTKQEFKNCKEGIIVKKFSKIHPDKVIILCRADLEEIYR